jgi:sugar lactone lactonase YvrE
MKITVPSLALVLAAGLGSTALAGLPPIFDAKPRALAAAHTVTAFPAGTFLENIVALPDGTLLVNSHLDGTIYRVAIAGGQASIFAKIPGTIAGISAADDGAFIVSGWADGKHPAVFTVSAAGQVETLVLLPDGQFPNGVTRLVGTRYLVADSYRGVIWEIDTAARTTRIWLESPELVRTDPNDPVPGVNGLKVHDGALYFSNTQASTLHQIALSSTGRPQGKPRLVAAPVNLDDFAFGPDGAIYGTTHVFNLALRVSVPDGAVSVIAEADAGVVGCTAAAFGATTADRDTLYVVGNGGLSMPPPGGPQPAKVVALKITDK